MSQMFVVKTILLNKLSKLNGVNPEIIKLTF